MSTAPGTITANPWNAQLAEKHRILPRAFRYALGTPCDAFGIPQLLPNTLSNQLRTIQIVAPAAGDNLIIPGISGVKQVYELALWNIAAQDLIWQQGTTGNHPLQLLSLKSFPALTPYTLPFSGNWDFAHWEIDTGQPLILNCSASTGVQGFIRYRVQNGTT
jgi:hypothetical protein